MIQFIIKILSVIPITGKSGVMSMRKRDKYTLRINAPDYQTALKMYREKFQGQFPSQYNYKLEITDNTGKKYDDVYW